jgi:hypothetical protein
MGNEKGIRLTARPRTRWFVQVLEDMTRLGKTWQEKKKKHNFEKRGRIGKFSSIYLHRRAKMPREVDLTIGTLVSSGYSREHCEFPTRWRDCRLVADC